MTMPDSRLRQRRITGWQRKYDGVRACQGAGNLTQRDVDALSLQRRRKSATVVDGGLIRGEVSDAIIEARGWADL